MPKIGGLYYETQGARRAPPVILSSGLGGSAAYWEPNVAALAEHFRVITYDHRGTGRSTRRLPDMVTVDDFARDILELMDRQNIERADIVGHAAGGVAGLALAAIAPKRLHRLIVVNGWAKPDPHFQRCFAARLALLRHAGVEAYLRAQPLFLYPPDWISKHDAWLEAQLPHQVADFPGLASLSKRVSALTSFRLPKEARRLEGRALVITAKDDMLVPPSASMSLASELRGRGLVMSGGHACNIVNADHFNTKAIEFLRS
ncbi:pyrimidine utilization protein D [Sphingomonas sp. SUN039]|uniref:pyrimidine utilization protein D n=1 Tax=Sphingomonas sp. SUN039 TaxID=2937787 RepID=UPI00216473E7|nr:pyrimidine utilization protein D [Sphingomonas sp. SUN039]UVO55490.1 pyrimidine utilization protein D [Sphingomonas sp. SUN039]